MEKSRERVADGGLKTGGLFADRSSGKDRRLMEDHGVVNEFLIESNQTVPVAP